jgi:hypothetical protein
MSCPSTPDPRDLSTGSAPTGRGPAAQPIELRGDTPGRVKALDDDVLDFGTFGTDEGQPSKSR